MKGRELVEEVSQMEKGELINFLLMECGDDHYDKSDLVEMTRQEILDRIADLHPCEDLLLLHSECQDGDYSPMHPNETEEEFFDHEDY